MSLLWTPERQRQATRKRAANVTLQKRGEILLPVRYEKDEPEPGATTREGRESEERDAWAWVEMKLRESGQTAEAAERKVRKVRELEQAKDREQGIDRLAIKPKDIDR